MSETLRQIPNFPDYMLSPTGKVWSKKWGGHWLKQTLLPNGFYSVGLYRAGKGFPRLAHRLVLLTYVGECPIGMKALHVNGDRTDNRISNLEWAFPKDVQSQANTVMRKTKGVCESCGCTGPVLVAV